MRKGEYREAQKKICPLNLGQSPTIGYKGPINLLQEVASESIQSAAYSASHDS